MNANAVKPLFRNAAVSPENRSCRGKPIAGTLLLSLPFENDMEKPQLILEITDAAMRAYVLENDSLQLLGEEMCSARSDAGYKQSLTDLLAKCGNTERFETFSCSYSDKKCVLVPMALFAEAGAEDFLRLAVHATIPKGETDYNRLPEWGIVNAFHLPLWIKSVLVLKIPRIVIQHELSHVLHHLNTGSLVPLRTHVILQENHFCCVMRRNGNIVQASYHQYQSAEDVLYHLLYTHQQEHIDTKGEIFLHASTQKAFETAEKTAALAASVEEFREQKISTHQNEHLLFQKLCV